VKTFHVYLHPARGYEAVPEGACLPALCFSVFWLIFRGLAMPAAVVVIGAALLAGAELTAGSNAVDAIQSWTFRLLVIAGVLALWLLPFFYGNQWRHADLLRRGFAQVACLTALSSDDAIARALSVEAVTTLSPEAAYGERPARRERRTSAARAAAKAPDLHPDKGLGGETLLAAR